MHTFRPLALFTGLVTLLLSSTGSALAQTPQRSARSAASCTNGWRR
jgi:hypothetical protein